MLSKEIEDFGKMLLRTYTDNDFKNMLNRISRQINDNSFIIREDRSLTEEKNEPVKRTWINQKRKWITS